MKLSGKITLLFADNGLDIEITDELSGNCFAAIHLSKDQTCKALSRLANTPCTLEVYNLDIVGKKMEMLPLTFDVTSLYKDNLTHDQFIEAVINEATKCCPIGWTPDNYYNSLQESFTCDTHRNWTAHTTIRCWIDYKNGL